MGSNADFTVKLYCGVLMLLPNFLLQSWFFKLESAWNQLGSNVLISYRVLIPGCTVVMLCYNAGF